MLLQPKSASLVGPEEIDGHLCQRVEMIFPSARPEEQLPVTAWFDPEAGYLPRQLSNDFNGEAPPSVYRVLSFREVNGGSQRPTLWFPERMIIERLTGTTELALLEIKLNEPLDAGLFRPKLTAGVPTFDLDNPAEQQRMVGLWSQPVREKKMAENRAAREARSQAGPTVAPVTLVPVLGADPPGRFGWPAVLLLTGLMMLVVGTIWVFRR